MPGYGSQWQVYNLGRELESLKQTGSNDMAG